MTTDSFSILHTLSFLNFLKTLSVFRRQQLHEATHVEHLKKNQIFHEKMRSIRSLLFALLITQIVGFGNTLGVELVTNLSEFGDGIFNFKETKEFVEIPEVTFPELNIFCYNGKIVLLNVTKIQSLISLNIFILSKSGT